VQGCRPILAQKLRYFEVHAFKGRWTPWRMEADEGDPGALISADTMK
jgi:type IV secretion system protein VirD4